MLGLDNLLLLFVQSTAVFSVLLLSAVLPLLYSPAVAEGSTASCKELPKILCSQVLVQKVQKLQSINLNRMND